MMRSDEDICRDVEAEMQWDPTIDDRNIHVSVAHGIVTLTGAVAHQESREAAETITRRVNGVRAIASELLGQPPGDPADTDLGIAEAALRALRRHVVTTNSRITPVVHDGWVLLSGHVTWICQKSVAEHAVRSLPGVKGVRSELIVTSGMAMDEIKHRIEEVFRHHALPVDEVSRADSADLTVHLPGLVREFQRVH